MAYRLTVVCLIILLKTASVSASVEDVFKLPLKQRLFWLESQSYWNSLDSLGERLRLDSLTVLSKKYKDDKFYWYVQIHKLMLRYQHPNDPSVTSIDQVYAILENARTQMENAPFPEISARYWHLYGKYFLGRDRFDDAFRLLFRAREQLESIGYDEVPFSAAFLNDIGLAYYRFRYFSTAEKYLKMAIQYPFPELRDQYDAVNAIGLCQRSLGNYDQAEKYFLICNALVINNQKIKPDLMNVIWNGIALGNYGSVLHLKKKYRKALYYYQLSVDRTAKDEPYDAASTYVKMADCYLMLGNAEKAKKMISSSENLRNKRKYLWSDVNRYHDFLFKARLNKQVKDFESSLKYQDSLLVVMDSLSRRSANYLLDINEKTINAEKYLSELRILESEKERAILLKDLIIVILLTLICGFTYLMYRRRLKLSAEKEVRRQKKEHAENNARQALAQLTLYVDMVNDKNNLISEINEKLQTLQDIPDSVQVEMHELTDKLINTVIITESDWLVFKSNFEKIYPGFFDKLKKYHADFTPSEIRLAALMKLNVPTREMAIMLNVNKETIHKSRYRLRKKLGQDGEIDLNLLIEQL